MGVLVTLLAILAGCLAVALARVVQSRERRDDLTREWIAYLQHDLSSSL